MKILKFVLLNIVLLLIIYSIVPTPSSAQQGGTPPTNSPQGGQPPISYKIEIPNPLKNDQRDLPELLTWIIQNAIVPIGAIVAALMIMYAGFMYVTARGNPAQISKANTALLYAAIGTAILLGAEVLAAAIKGTVDQIGK